MCQLAQVSSRVYNEPDKRRLKVHVHAVKWLIEATVWLGWIRCALQADVVFHKEP